MPRPKPFYQVFDPDKISDIRKVNCEHYYNCLSLVERLNWDGFHCNDCDDFSLLNPAIDFHGCENLIRELSKIVPFSFDDSDTTRILKEKRLFKSH